MHKFFLAPLKINFFLKQPGFRLVGLSLFMVTLSFSVLLSLEKVVSVPEVQVIASNIPTNQIKAVNAQVLDEQSVILPPIAKSRGLKPPLVTAAAALVKDFDTDLVLFAKEPNKQLPIASTTKIMTAWLASGYFQPNDILTVPKNLNIEGSNMGLKPNEKINFRSLLYGLLLNSGNDAAYVIADNFPGGVDSFVAAMNKKAKTLGLVHTHFDNPAGFDSPDHYSSASDLLVIAKAAESDNQIARVVATKETLVASSDKSIVHNLKNLNKLLDQPGFLGIKTGTTPQAKENLVALTQKDNHKYLTVVLGSDDRFTETESILNWVLANYSWD